jgi:Cu/Ag efflux pump CusA
VVADVERALSPIRAELSQSPGYSIRIGGQFEAQQEATRLITLFGLISLAAMFFVLFLHFKSINLSLQVLMSIPMAFIGAVVYIVLSGQAVSVATLVGFISLGGIASRNAILLIDHYLHLMREEKEPFGPAMIIRAGQERMVPVLMTALTTGIALIPLALAPGRPGREILYPVATVIIGGLISSTLLDFLVRPALFWTFGKKESERLAALLPQRDRASEEIAKEYSMDV